MKDILRQFFVIVSVASAITLNALASILPINGQNTGQISDSFKVYFVPAGYVFSIWGIIYIGMITYTIYQALPSRRQDSDMRASGWWYALGGFANGAWILAWHYLQFPLSVAIMALLLVSLIMVYLALRPSFATATTSQKWLVHYPVSLYLGWITVASVANITVLLEWANWDGFGLSDLAWMGIVLGAVALIAGLMNWRQRDLPFSLVLLWALAGIALKHAATPFVVWASWAVFAWVLVSYLFAITIGRQRNQGAG